jgi:hypothetical protein
MWIFAVKKTAKIPILGSFGSLQGRILAFATPKFEILNRLSDGAAGSGAKRRFNQRCPAYIFFRFLLP